MLAFRVKAAFLGYGPELLSMVVRADSKKQVEDLLRREKWIVKRISQATMDDIRDFPTYEELLPQVKAEVRRKRELAEENERRAEYERQCREQEELRAQAAEEEAARLRHERAIQRTVGDLLDASLERELSGNSRVASICAKTLLFFDQANVSRREIFTAISIDFADFQAQTACPLANRMISALLAELNEYLQIDERMLAMGQHVEASRISAENQINAIGSRTHVFGGSGGWLLLSALAAESAVRQDEKAIRELQAGHQQVVYRAQLSAVNAQMKQLLLQFRAKTAVSVLLLACGKSSTIDVNMPPGLEEYVLTGAR